MTLWRWAELCEACDQNLDETGQCSDITGICIDSRIIEPGDLFIALAGDPGPRFRSGGG